MGRSPYHPDVVLLGWVIAVVSVAVGCWGAWLRRRTSVDALLILVGGVAIAVWNLCCAYYLVGPLDYRVNALYLLSVSVAVTLWTVIAYRSARPGWWPPLPVAVAFVAEPLLVALSAALPEHTWGHLFWPSEPWRDEPLGIGYQLHSPYCIGVLAAGAAPLLRRSSETSGLERILCGASVGVVAMGVGGQIAGVRAMPYTAFGALIFLVALLVYSDHYDLRILLRSVETDPVTGGMARRGLDRVLERAAANASGMSDSPLSLMVIDIDDFKTINDTFGHLAGDAVLRHVTDRIGTTTGGMVGRFGGDELVVVLPGADIETARELGRQVAADAGLRLDLSGTAIRPTVSVGVASYCGDSVELLLAEADRAMYAVKRRGGNGVAEAAEVVS